MPDLHLDYRDPEWVAQQLGIDKNAVYRYLDEGRLPGLRLGRKWLISESTLVEQLKREERDQTELRRMVSSKRAAVFADEFMERAERLPFTERARRALELARDESAAAGHSYIGQEHFLLAFERDPECAAAQMLTNLRFDARAAVEAIIAPGDSPPTGDAKLTPRALRALELALKEARRRKDANVGTEHMLLGIVRLGEGLGFDLLRDHGIGMEQLEGELANVKRSSARAT